MARPPNASGRLTSASDFSTPQRSSDARIDPTEVVEEGAAARTTRRLAALAGAAGYFSLISTGAEAAAGR
jgi:hypothetical protein